MTLNDFVLSRQRAISANFALRNRAPYSRQRNPERLLQWRAQQRATIRRFIQEVRLSKSKDTAHIMSKAVANLVTPKFN